MVGRRVWRRRRRSDSRCSTNFPACVLPSSDCMWQWVNTNTDFRSLSPSRCNNNHTFEFQKLVAGCISLIWERDYLTAPLIRLYIHICLWPRIPIITKPFEANLSLFGGQLEHHLYFWLTQWIKWIVYLTIEIAPTLAVFSLLNSRTGRTLFIVI